MISVDNDALVCDFAETYHIYDYRALPPITAAALALGLPDNSRIKMKISGSQLTIERILLAMAVDRLSSIAWLLSDDARTGKNRPKSILNELLTNEKQGSSDDIQLFSGADEFMRARATIINKIQNESGG